MEVQEEIMRRETFRGDLSVYVLLTQSSFYIDQNLLLVQIDLLVLHPLKILLAKKLFLKAFARVINN